MSYIVGFSLGKCYTHTPPTPTTHPHSLFHSLVLGGVWVCGGLCIKVHFSTRGSMPSTLSITIHPFEILHTQEHKSMDASILADTISDILQWTSSLKPLPIYLSAKDISHLKNHLEDIRAKVKKAKQINHYSSSQTSEEVQLWLQNVKGVIIDLKDLMEEDLHNQENSSTGSRLKVKYLVKNAAKEIKRLSEKAQTMSFPEEEEKEAAEMNSRKRYDEFAKGVVAVGRENEKKKVIDQLLNGDVAVPVVAIVGVPGIGKTKLARLVYEDKQVNARFSFQTWVDHLHHETFDVESIAESVTKSATSSTEGQRRYLLVLDDLRIEIDGECLEKLKQKLTEVGLTRGAILITTRSNLVANNIAGVAARHVLQGLNEKDSRALFQRVHRAPVLSNDVVWEIVRECGGVPLAIIIIARLLNNRRGTRGNNSSVPVEEEFLQELKITYYEDLPTYQKLCFSYCSLFPPDYLFDAERLIQLWMAEGFLTRSSSNNNNNTIPRELIGRACFDDFVPLVFQQVGAEEGEEEDECGVVVARKRLYRMNRIMHELARVVSTVENVTVDWEGKRVNEGMLRASFDFALDLSCGIPDSVFAKAKKLSSILLLRYNNSNATSCNNKLLLTRMLSHEVRMTTSTCDKIFNTFKRLHVLDLHDLMIKTVPSSIGEVKHLTHLDLSHNNMEKLPGSITKLVHLQTLKLSQCHVLKELPKDSKDLSSLRHLDIEGCLSLTHMPAGMSKLTCLQTLPLFVATKNQVMGGLRELTDLNDLRGNLEISHLEQFKFCPSKEVAKDAFLKNKQHLQCLSLRWDHDKEEEEEVNIKGGSSGSTVDDEKSLEYLEPHQNLGVLFVAGYNGNTFSNWLSSLQYLVKFSLNDCPKCQFLPPLDHLPHLKVLQLRRLNSLKFIAKNTEASSQSSGSSTSTSTPFFPSLKKLTISDCPNLKGWWEDDIGRNDRPFFTCISILDVQYCPKLACMPLYPYIDEELVLVDSNVTSILETMSANTSEAGIPPFSKLKSMLIARNGEKPPPESWLRNFTSLEKLHIRECSQLESLPQGFKSLTSLLFLTIERCPKLDLGFVSSKNEWEGLKNLRSLTLRDIPKLKSLPREVGSLTSLQDLRIYECSGLTCLPESIGNLASLGKLVISKCKSLESLPKGMQKLKSLHTLIIMDCPLLMPRCQPETGDDWQQIAHIKNIHVKDTPEHLRDL